MTETVAGTEAGTYTIRPFREGDTEPYLELYRDVFGTRPTDDWFRWKYQENPYVDHVPIYVAEANGVLVGARSFFALPLRTGSGSVLALQPCDTMVQEAHRRQGLFTRMTEAAIDRYRDGEPELFFNFPNSRTRAGNRKLGWKVVTEKELFYRLQNPAAIAKSAGDGGVIDLVSSAASPIVAGYVGACDRLAAATRPSTEAVIERHETIPAERLAALYRAAVPDAFHVERDEQFLQWRFRNPAWEYVTYLARDDTEDVAAIVAGTRTIGDITKTTIVDVLSRDDETAVVEALLVVALDDSRGADLIGATDESIPRETLLKHGFLPDSKPPLSPVTETTTLMVRSLSDDATDADETAWALEGKAIDEPKNWRTTFVSRDTE